MTPPNIPQKIPLPKPVKRKPGDRAPWWSYVLFVILSLPIVLLFAHRLATYRASSATYSATLWLIFLDIACWIYFVVKNRNDKNFNTYLPWSMLVLYVDMFVMMVILSS